MACLQALFYNRPDNLRPGTHDPAGILGLFSGYYHNKAHAHVECPVHLVIVDIPLLLQEPEDRLRLQWIGDLEAQIRDPMQLEKSGSGYVRKAMHIALPDQLYDLGVVLVGVSSSSPMVFFPSGIRSK